MANTHGETRVCIACNEDGFGPSALGFYIARHLIESWERNRNTRLSLTVLNRSAEDFNRKLYAGLPVRVEPLDSLISLSKLNGEVHVPQTLERLRGYAARRATYAAEAQKILEGCSVAIDIGVPIFARAAAQWRVPHRLTVFDHSWAATLRLMVSEEWLDVYRDNPRPSTKEHVLAKQIAAEIEADETHATEVFLFDSYLTPGEFVRHWQALGFTPRILIGVLGSQTSRDAACAKLDATLAEYGNQRPAPRNKPLILLCPGGTPVWDTQLPRLLEQLLDGVEPSCLFVIAKDLSLLLDRRNGLLARIQHSDRIRYFGPLRSGTLQALLPAFRRIVTRAGGGTVNDALAAGVEFVFVEEPQVQVKLIERACAALGLTAAAAPLEEFRQDPRRCIDRLAAMPLPNAQVAPTCGAEATVVEQILSWLHDF